MTIISKQMKKHVRRIQRELRQDISYVTVVSITTAACTACTSDDSITGMPFDSFCDTCKGLGYTETENERVLDATLSFYDTRAEFQTYLKSGAWFPGTVKIIADKEHSVNPVTKRTYFRESKYMTLNGENDKYQFVMDTIGSFGISVTVLARKIS